MEPTRQDWVNTVKAAEGGKATALFILEKAFAEFKDSPLDTYIHLKSCVDNYVTKCYDLNHWQKVLADFDQQQTPNQKENQ